MPSCPELELIDGFFDAAESARLYQQLLHGQDWPDNRYIVAGRQFILPRLQTWHADPGIRYSYSNNLLETRPWTPLLSEIRARVESYLNFQFNSVLVNLYRNGEDYVGWHSDNEPELGGQPLIASLSLGEERPLQFRHKQSSDFGQVLLRSGSLLVMQPDFQHLWLHSVPIDPNVTVGRINLTFRKVISVSKGFFG
ncbi:MAG: alpha-ketoglutarate-dependent dioxygenase AlkB [Methylovulum sp.]|uniref:alpha-ketoglutarate-dependent dioxygenase AlkB family protein n=1 Tax=Methylovulum sp. TaxID=1916980 RepID=UPI00260DFD28|nr:alpha-ketoglutarate-dependent dioxygenase AlkB [Methylovulum sp.]MDD2723364.1 alpha-ketoglutarate-dependent dioxygenase AlkB [Methylovulum sp.]MDD5124269.1 alpha-ketoglutarate-dependent dioxygenase AlkB [Methylovulum sp.]